MVLTFLCHETKKTQIGQWCPLTCSLHHCFYKYLYLFRTESDFAVFFVVVHIFLKIFKRFKFKNDC